MSNLPLPLFLVSPASLTMMRTSTPEAVQLFTDKADADAFAARFPYTRRMELTTPEAVGEMLRTAPGHFTGAAIRSRDTMTRYSMRELAQLCGASLTPTESGQPSPWLSAAGGSPSRKVLLTQTHPPAASPASPPPAAAAPDEHALEMRRIREKAYRDEVQNC